MKRIYKVYNDGGAFIGIRKTESNSAPRRKPAPEELIAVKYDSENEGNAVAIVHDEDYENMIDPVLCGNECEKCAHCDAYGRVQKVLQADGGNALEEAQEVRNRQDAPVLSTMRTICNIS